MPCFPSPLWLPLQEMQGGGGGGGGAAAKKGILRPRPHTPERLPNFPSLPPLPLPLPPRRRRRRRARGSLPDLHVSAERSARGQRREPPRSSTLWLPFRGAAAPRGREGAVEVEEEGAGAQRLAGSATSSPSPRYTRQTPHPLQPNRARGISGGVGTTHSDTATTTAAAAAAARCCPPVFGNFDPRRRRKHRSFPSLRPRALCFSSSRCREVTARIACRRLISPVLQCGQLPAADSGALPAP